MFAVADVVSPMAEGEPSGPNLEYDAAYMALLDLAAGKPEQQFGDTVIPAVDPEWPAVHEQSLALLGRSRDLRLAVLLTQAAARVHGLPGAARGLAVVAGLLDTLWDSVHPQLDADDDNDPTMRVNALTPLAAPLAGLAALRAASLDGGERGLRLRRLELAAGRAVPFDGESVPAPAEIEHGLREAAGRSPSLADDLRACLDAARRIDATLRERLASSQLPELAPLLQLLAQADDVATRLLGVASPAPDVPIAAGASMPIGAQAAAPGAPASRQDVLRMLDVAIDWLERNEPTNPAPLLLRRAQRLMGMNFMEIIRDLAPDGWSQVETIAGRPPD